MNRLTGRSQDTKPGSQHKKVLRTQIIMRILSFDIQNTRFKQTLVSQLARWSIGLLGFILLNYLLMPPHLTLASKPQNIPLLSSEDITQQVGTSDELSPASPSVVGTLSQNLQSNSFEDAITIDNTGYADNLTNYVVTVTADTANLISAGRIRSDCGDIRFLDSDHQANLAYWLESGCDTSSTVIRVKIPFIPASATKTIYMTYGNSLLTSASDGNSVFLLFDDFNGTSLDISKWTIGLQQGYADVSVHDGVLDVFRWRTSANNIVDIVSDSTLSNLRGLLIETRQSLVGNSQWYGFHSIYYGSSSTYNSVGFTNIDMIGVYESALYTGSSKFPPRTANSFSEEGYIIIDPPLDYYISYFHIPISGSGGFLSHQYSNIGLWQTSTNYEGLNTGKVGFYFGTTPTGAYSLDKRTIVDWVLVRDYVTPDPETSLGSSPQAYSITGTVTWTQSGNPISEVTVEAQQGGVVIGSDTTDSEGVYEITGLAAGTYGLTASREGYTFESAADGSETIQVQITNADVPDQNFVVVPPPPPPVLNVGFKGAGWLRFMEEVDTDYENNGVGWNVDMIDHIIPENSNLPAEIENFADAGVETIVRLDIPGNAVGPIQLRGVNAAQYATNQNRLNQIIAAGDCAAPEITNWMENLDTFYTRFLVNGDPALAPSVTYFILGNEPNHISAEWNYTAEQYAFVYNCYYHHWLNAHFEPGGERRPHALLVAGPGHEPGRPNQWDVFLPELFNSINDSDGFAMHVYGYYDNGGDTDDADGNDLFKRWLDMTMSNMQTRAVDKPLIITEYNPGADIRVVNAPPHGWEDWFDRTYCWVESAQNNYPTVDLLGLIYYVDEPDAERHNDPRDENGQLRPWWPVSLRSDGISGSAVEDDARRQAWLLLDENFDGYTVAPDNTDYQDWCPGEEGMQEQNIDNLYASTGPIMLPLMEPQPLAQTTPSDVSIGGIISGTLGIWGGNQIYYVTEDLEIPVGEILEIEAGTTLVFSPSLQMEVRGQLLARGNTVLPVRFINPDEAGWLGIHFYPTASRSRCIGCYLENISAGGTALTTEAPITFQSGLIRDVPDGVAISSTVPLTLSHTVIDYVGTGVQLSGQSAQSYALSHLTINRCQQAVVNQGQSLNLDNSILTTCNAAISTTLSGITAISYTLFEANTQDFVTQSGSNLLQGPGLLNANAGFVDFPNDVRLRSDSPAVNAGDPEADYSYEQGYNGGRADLGAYGNTWRAPQQPPLDQMQVSVTADTLQQSGAPGQVLSFTITVRNTGSITDTYFLSTDASWEQNGQIQGKMIKNLAPQTQISTTLWVNIPVTPTTDLSDTISIVATGDYGIQDELELTIQITTTAYQEVNGQVVMEAEHFMFDVEREGQAWITQTVLSDYTGPGYVSLLPDIDRRYPVDDETAGGPQLVYMINFSTAGTYTLWLRGYAPNAAGDSVYVALDGQSPATLTGFTPRQWEWAAKELMIEVAQPGLYALYIRQREDGLRLDRILLTTDDTYVPIGSDPGESEIR